MRVGGAVGCKIKTQAVIAAGFVVGSGSQRLFRSFWLSTSDSCWQKWGSLADSCRHPWRSNQCGEPLCSRCKPALPPGKACPFPHAKAASERRCPSCFRMHVPCTSSSP